MSFLSKLIYRFNTILVRIPAEYFCRNQQADSKIYMEKKTTIAKVILKMKNKSLKIYSIWFKDWII